MTAITRTPGTAEYGAFDFGLDDAQEQRARRLLAEHPSVDMAYHGPASPDVFRQYDLEQRFMHETAGAELYQAWTWLLQQAIAGSFPDFRQLFDQSGVTCAWFPFKLRDAEDLLFQAVLREKIRRRLPWLRLVETAADIREAHTHGEHAFFALAQENFLRPDGLPVLEQARALGLVTADCAYNNGTFIGTGCTERRDAGLTNFGVSFVKACNDLQVIVDTAHSGRATTLDACEHSSQPVLATHTCAAGVFQTDRAKSDDELRAIADTGGVVGAFAMPFFLATPEAHATVEAVLDHIDYLVNLIGVRHVGIGTDWPLPLTYEYQNVVMLPLSQSRLGFREEHHLSAEATLEGFRDTRDWPNLVRGLVSRGYSDADIAAIIGGNFLRVLEQVRG